MRVLTSVACLTFQRMYLNKPQQNFLLRVSSVYVWSATMFFCAISGEPLQDAVFSPKSGQLYERRLILKYVTENGKDPVSGEKLDESDLVSVKAGECPVLPQTRCLDACGMNQRLKYVAEHAMFS